MGPPSNVQGIIQPNTIVATFLILRVKDADKCKDVVAATPDLTKNVAVRDVTAKMNVTVGIGSNVWDAITGLPRPSELHPFKEFKGKTHTAPSTPGDLLFHIRANRRDLIFEFERQLLDRFGSAAETVDEVSGFRYFDGRNLLGFVDGTANPVGPDLPESCIVTAEQCKAGAGGSYLVIQKYMHDLAGWGKLKVEEQEAAIGRTKIDNIETEDAAVDAQKSHRQLSTIDVDGEELDILRDNLPFGRPGHGEYGTFFIGYSRRLWVTEKMLENMFIGVPPGKHDRMLDFSKAVTGNVYFVPSSEMLESLG
ncbi:hypothetical protein CcaverHIS002_0211430 [Cutaneotrichosporon cavernicola]|uniref:Dyp-type peroxidase n=1 Tax=Cutaneotrichosporon cavernicola TaxID=279322 RepID=A0AA48L0E4_9TREE|nr:uncharacterized protein CcaverHIS019_0211430 [Cutaneotrichosporon cavernicola]BEI81983.1 hypothetical protein CcaverHIS002_0211430 [Cutaneotrichosporon cavernicola]BEI89781.1 hypothetical protein CcaverHIS019_0211430 [Cutaneotrichosporon cavernicola]BEI97552.1 hypothetical protein CcaverHIS631_0211410 [Cutaneotrichosporon cavernicola]BEJ05331.1 hypothetical protein CcaverHIS641_0211480 [Cutaneotrichosporon cavernicola]